MDDFSLSKETSKLSIGEKLGEKNGGKIGDKKTVGSSNSKNNNGSDENRNKSKIGDVKNSSPKNDIADSRKNENNQSIVENPFRGNQTNMSTLASGTMNGTDTGILSQDPYLPGPSSSVGRVFNLLPQVQRESFILSFSFCSVFYCVVCVI